MPTPQLGWAKPRPRSGIGQAGRLSPQLPSYLRGNAALSMVVFGQGKKMGAAFSILYLHGVRQEGSIV
ncbi:hypothetical protein DWX93_04855 [Roseburia hominis]|uniref:Uncharacterized protein n=1 Tax=Roseburia hominis TaxID=301301 RepID=A0A395VG05_9FIRM|nr:hypothetical protein DWX93_04855 [Roseburia hominis]